MAKTKVGSFALRTTTGNQAITGLGFAPVAVIFIADQTTAEGTAASVMRSFGVADGHGNRWRLAARGTNGTNNADGYFASNGIILLVNTLGAATEAADIVSLDADGFTINVSIASAARVIRYYAIGGDDITDAKAGTFQVDASLGLGDTQAITGVGFQPSAVLFGNNSGTSDPGAESSDGQDPSNFHVGFSDGSASAGATHFMPYADASYRDRAGRTTKVFQIDNIFGVTMELSLQSLDADGFTLLSSGVADDANQCGFLAIEGGDHQVGTFNQKTSTGLQVVSTVGEPEGVMIVGGYDQGTNDPQANQAATWGFSDGTDDGSIGSSSSRGVFAAHDKARRNSDSVVAFIDAPSGLTGEADVDSFEPGSFTLDWTTADGVARNLAFWVIGPPDEEFVPQIYRRVSG